MQEQGSEDLTIVVEKPCTYYRQNITTFFSGYVRVLFIYG